jgi:tetratricopeptide (TPR) repeat protein
VSESGDGRWRWAILAGLVIGTVLARDATPATTAPPPAGTTAAPHTATKSATKPGSKPTTSATHKKTTAASTQSVEQLASQTRLIEEVGGWPRAAELLRQLRGRTAPDADLDLMLAWFEARSGDLDSAAARLRLPTLVAAGDDSMPPARWTTYPWQHEGAWLDGRFDGWHWYVWRTRAEIAAATGRWDTALAAARRAVAARPLAGSEWYVRALCAAHLGLRDEARACTDTALVLDATLPEAHELAGLLAWRDGRRGDARQHLDAALALDSTYARPALGLVRLRLPGTPPDTLPTELFEGVRRAALLTAPEGPRPEVFTQNETAALLIRRVTTADMDTSGLVLKTVQRVRLTLMILVDARGRAALVDVPEYTGNDVAPAKVSRIIATLPDWRFRPATRGGRPAPSWVGYEFVIIP